LEEAEGSVPEALVLYRQSAEMVRQERKTISDEVLRGSFLTERLQLYERLVLNLLNRQEYAEAFHWLEQSRSKAMLDMLATAEVRFQTPDERLLFADWVAARARDSAAMSGGKLVSPGANTEAVLQRIRTKAPKLLELGESEPLSLRQMQSLLAADPCDLVYFMLHQGRVVLWHSGPTRISVQAYFAATSQLQSLSRRVVTSASFHGDFDLEAAGYLYSYLARPALDQMETKHLVVIAPPELSGLPFQILFDKDTQQFLGEQIALSSSPSASLLAKLKPARALRPGNLLVMIGPDLPTHGSEAEGIAAQYPKHTILRGAGASFESLMKEAKGRSAIHIAAHGEYDDEAPMLSRILLSGGPNRGETTAAQLMALPLGGVSVVSLGSCSAGKAQVDAGGENYGFIRSLLYAGAQSLVLPLWKVPDDAAAYWFEIFYSGAAAHDLAEAARLANVATRKRFGAHPRFWGGYQFVGL
jgi:CHAT domain-containing protein